MAAALPATGEDYYAGLRADYAARRRLMGETLAACGFAAAEPEGAYYAFAAFDARAGEPGFEDDRAANETLIARAGVATVPGSAFFTDPADGRRFLRFCFAKEMGVLEEACERLTKAFG
jgi:aminotransferase